MSVPENWKNQGGMNTFTKYLLDKIISLLYSESGNLYYSLLYSNIEV